MWKYDKCYRRSGGDEGGGGFWVTILKRKITISTCWGVFGFFCSIWPIYEFLIQSKSVCVLRPYPFCIFTCVFWCSLPSWSNSKCPRESRGRILILIEYVPFFLRSLTIFWPVKSLILGTASLSLMATPIWEGDMPFLAMVTINYEIDFGVWATHLAHLLLNGVTVELIPFPFPFDWILPIIIVDFLLKN